MGTTMPLGRSPIGARPMKDTAIIVAVFGSASNKRTRVQISYIRRPGSRSAAGLSPETRQCVGRFYSSQQKWLGPASELTLPGELFPAGKPKRGYRRRARYCCRFEILEKRLAEAERRLVDARAHVRRQKELIESLERDGLSVAAEFTTLKNLQTLVGLRLENRDQLMRELHKPS